MKPSVRILLKLLAIAAIVAATYYAGQTFSRWRCEDRCLDAETKCLDAGKRGCAGEDREPRGAAAWDALPSRFMVGGSPCAICQGHMACGLRGETSCEACR